MRYRCVIGLIGLFFCLTSCHDTAEEKIITLSASTSTFQFPFVGGSQEFTVFSNTEWVTSELSEWCRIDCVAGEGDVQINLTVARNPQETERMFEFQITSDTLKTTFTILQAGDSRNMTDSIKDEKFRNYCLAEFDTDADGILFYRELLAADSINVMLKGITSVEGIEHFSELRVLYCSYNNLTTLDVSRNSKLTELWCESNGLTGLNVSQNTELKELMCGDNPLYALDVSNNTGLTYLSCFLNELDQLDISRNTELRALYCYWNQLNTLDISNNMNLKILECTDNEDLETIFVWPGFRDNMLDMIAPPDVAFVEKAQ